MRIDITDAEDIITARGIHFLGSPCNNMNFTGFSAINGTYYIDWPFEGGEIELGRWAATNGPLTDGFGYYYCVYARLSLSVTSTDSLGNACFGYLCLCIFIETKFDSSPCTPIEDVLFISCWNGACGSFGSDLDVPLGICESGSQSIAQPTTSSDIDCPSEYYNWTATWTPQT